MRDHRKLLIWQRAHTLTIEVRRAARTFPRSGYTSIRAQMIRAAESIVLTIVEGCGSASQREFARFLDMSLKSSAELEEELELAKDYGVLQDKRWRPLRNELVEIRRMTCALRAKVLRDAEDEERDS